MHSLKHLRKISISVPFFFNALKFKAPFFPLAPQECAGSHIETKAHQRQQSIFQNSGNLMLN